MVPDRQGQVRDTARLEAEPDRPPSALSSSISVRHLCSDTAALQLAGYAVRGRAVRGQYREHRPPELSGPVDQHALLLVARARPRPSDKDRYPRNGACKRALLGVGFNILATALIKRLVGKTLFLEEQISCWIGR